MMNLTSKRATITATPKAGCAHFRQMLKLGAVLLATVLGVRMLHAETPEQRAWSMLRNGIHESDTGKRTQAVFALRLLPFDPEATELAEAALRDRKPDVRAAAATALGSIGSTEAIPELKKAMNDKRPAVATAAAHSLLLLNDPAGYEVYYELLIGERKASGGVGAQEAATFKGWKNIAELGLSQGLAFFPGGSVAFSAAMALRPDDASPARAAAVTALADDMDPRIRRALVRATSDKNCSIRASALLAIAERSDPDLLNAIVPALSDKNQVVRFTAAAAVIRLSTVATMSNAPNVAEGQSTPLETPTQATRPNSDSYLRTAPER